MILLSTLRNSFHDEFGLAKAVGSVNSSSCDSESGLILPAAIGGTRTVVDTESKLSISNGKLAFAGGKASPSSGDPGEWLTTAITRTAGQILAFKITPTDATKILGVGASNAKTGAVVGNGLRIDTDLLKPLDGSTTGPGVFVPLDGVDYTLVCILRAAGAQFFVKSGTGVFKRVWSYSTNNTSSLYVAIAGNTLAGTVDFVRIPKTRWLPTPLLSDSFAASDATPNTTRQSDGLGHAETTGLGSGGIATWSGASGAIQSNRLVITPTLGSELLTNGTMETGSPPTGWTGYNATLSANADANRGTQSLNIVRTGVNSNAYQQISNNAMNWFAFSCYIKSATNITDFYLTSSYSSLNSSILSTGIVVSWAKTFCVTRSNLTNPYFIINPHSTPSVNALYDDVTLKTINISTCFNTTTLSTKDIEIRTSFQMTTGTQAGIVMGLNDAGTSFILAYHDGNGNIKLEICESGTYTTKNTTAATYGSDYELRVARRTQSNGTSEVWVWYNNVLIGAGPTTTLSSGESTNLSGLKAGLFSTYEGNSFNDCVIYNVGTDGSYSILDRLIGQ